MRESVAVSQHMIFAMISYCRTFTLLKLRLIIHEMVFIRNKHMQAID